MQRVILGGSDVEVSEICLGTMTFGNQTSEAEAHAQMDAALEAGLQGQCGASADFREGVASFQQRRQPVYSDV